MKQERISFCIGLAVFLLGIGLLLFTFYTAYLGLTQPSSLSAVNTLAPEVEGQAGKLVEPMVEMMPYSVAALLLWVMGSVSGRLAKRGMEMARAKTSSTQAKAKEEPADKKERKKEEEEGKESEADKGDSQD